MTTRLDEAATLHRQATATAAAVAGLLDRPPPAAPPATDLPGLAARLARAAAALAPDWLGAPLVETFHADFGTAPRPRYVRVGVGRPRGDAQFPVVVPLLGEGHLAVDRDAADPRVAGLLRALLLRLLAAAPAGTLLVRTADPAGGGLFAPFASLTDAGILAPPATDAHALRAVLAEAEQWIAPARGRRPRHDRTLLLVVAGLPDGFTRADLGRIGALAQHGPEAGLHLVVAGWPPAPTAADPAARPLPRATQLAVGDSFALVGDPPGGLFGVPAPGAAPPAGSTGLNAPVVLDPDPPAALVARLCAAAGVAGSGAMRLADLLPVEDTAHVATDGLVTMVGADGDRPVELRLGDLTPHWLIGGRRGAGRSAFLLNVVHGLAARYRAEELELYVVDLGDGGVAAEVAPGEDGWLPQVRVVGVAADREYGLAVLRELTGELHRRARACEALDVPGYAQLRADGPRLPRLVCVVDDFPRLVADDDRLTADAWALLDDLARRGRTYGVHLVLAGADLRALPALANARDSLGGQFPVRVALPGGSDVLDPTNEAAAALALGTAVVNTAGGFGGPRGATRGHERTVRFPDPYASRATLTARRRRGFTTRGPGTGPPAVFHGGAVPRLADDPTYRAALVGQVTRPAVLLGHTVALPRATAAFPLDKSAGRHLAIVSPGGDGARLLDTAARSLAIPDRPTRFVVCAAEVEGAPAADLLAKELAGTHEVDLVDAGGLRYAVDGPAHVIVFGMDALLDTDQLPREALRDLLHGGPARGVHVVSWWRSARRLSDALGARGRDDLAGLVFLDVSNIDVAALTGQPLDWRYRPQRALLFDRHADRASVIVPFAAAEGAR
ncbi:hypothetical protein GCM10010124_00560 [Pilimelia terevasa]|uniref:FtsK domain-containing protein n=1 Tax=Pilimelia terevasa TaxID=53372 RepID=A0A8J3BCR1_9ACTN|nr:FtsK/SpoIIIE domain-containing protein [Pilimelia terevasa]GGK11801.1 hypothetical protein GCM10010124_00560 [Pilimelia terevasa]